MLHPLPGAMPGPRSISSEHLVGLATAALRRAARPPGGDVRLVAAALGFAALPVSSEYDGGTCHLTSTTRIVYCREGDARQLDHAVRHALAHGLLRRAGFAHDEADVSALADLLRA